MIIFLYGSDSYRRGERLREIVAQYLGKYADADFLDVDLEENPENWEHARDFLAQPSLFVRSKLCLVRNSGVITEKNGFSKSQIEEWKELLRSHLDGEKVFLLISDSSAPLKAFQFLLKKPARAQEFGVLGGKELEVFVLREAGTRGLTFSPEAKRLFLEYVSSFSDASWVAVREIEKISLAGFRQPVSLQDLQNVISWARYDKSYQIAVSLIRTNEGSDKLRFLEELKLRGDEPRYTLNLLGSLVWGEDAVSLARIDEMVKGGESEDEVALTGFALGV